MDTLSSTPSKQHVVIIDDNAELAWFFAEILKLHGYETIVFSEAAAALTWVLAQPPAVIICDLQMPQVNGELFYAAVTRAQPALARRFIFVTGTVDEKALRRLGARVSAPILHKPVAVETLLAEVARVGK